MNHVGKKEPPPVVYVLQAVNMCFIQKGFLSQLFTGFGRRTAGLTSCHSLSVFAVAKRSPSMSLPFFLLFPWCNVLRVIHAVGLEVAKLRLGTRTDANREQKNICARAHRGGSATAALAKAKMIVGPFLFDQPAMCTVGLQTM